MDALSSGTFQIIVGASGAFFGAMFAFLFGLATYYWTKWLERQKIDHNGMVKLESILNNHLNTFATNQVLMHGAIDTLNHGFMTYNILRPYRLENDMELLFLDLEVINKYFSYKELASSLNDDFEVTNRANDILREVVLSGRHNEATIKANAQNLVERLTTLSKFASTFEGETKSLLCLVRLKLKYSQLGLLGIKRLFKRPHEITDQEITNEMIKLEGEIAKTKEDSVKIILKSL